MIDSSSGEDKPELLFTDNETNNQRLFHTPNPSPFVKDGINSCVVEGNPNAVNPKHTGTKAAARYILKVRPRSEAVNAPQRPNSRLRVELRRRQPARPRVAALYMYRIEQAQRGEGDRSFLARIFAKLMPAIRPAGRGSWPRIWSFSARSMPKPSSKAAAAPRLAPRRKVEPGTQ